MLRHGDQRFDAADVARAQGDAARLPFASDTFDAATVAFGIRNVAETERAFAEMARVVRPGGRVVCLEFAEPPPGLFRTAFEWYSRWVLPTVGGAISGRREAYAYLPASVARFASRERLAGMMRGGGLGGRALGGFDVWNGVRACRRRSLPGREALRYGKHDHGCDCDHEKSRPCSGRCRLVRHFWTVSRTTWRRLSRCCKRRFARTCARPMPSPATRCLRAGSVCGPPWSCWPPAPSEANSRRAPSMPPPGPPN